MGLIKDDQPIKRPLITPHPTLAPLQQYKQDIPMACGAT
jgi:hypothetical protein